MPLKEVRRRNILHSEKCASFRFLVWPYMNVHNNSMKEGNPDFPFKKSGMYTTLMKVQSETTFLKEKVSVSFSHTIIRLIPIPHKKAESFALVAI